jgi:hypothetical protein
MGISLLATIVLVVVSAIRAALLLRIGKQGESIAWRAAAAFAAAAATLVASIQIEELKLPQTAQYLFVLCGHTLLVGICSFLSSSPGYERFIPLLSLVPLPVAIVALGSSPWLAGGSLLIMVGLTVLYFVSNISIGQLIQDGDLAASLARRMDLSCAAMAGLLILSTHESPHVPALRTTAALLIASGLWWRLAKSDGG